MVEVTGLLFLRPLRAQGDTAAALGALAEAPPSACKLLEVCIQVEQNSVVTVILRDNLLEARPRAHASATPPLFTAGTCPREASALENAVGLPVLTSRPWGRSNECAELGRPLIKEVQFRYYGTERGAQAPFVSVAPWGDDRHLFPLTFVTPVKGFMFLEVSIDGIPMRGSPLVVSVVEVSCPGDIAFPRDNGTCTCPPGYADFAANAGDAEPCVRLPVVDVAAREANVKAIVPPVVLGTLALFVAIAVAASWHAREAAEKSWRIRAEELDVSSSQVRDEQDPHDRRLKRHRLTAPRFRFITTGPWAGFVWPCDHGQLSRDDRRAQAWNAVHRPKINNAPLHPIFGSCRNNPRWTARA